MSDVANQTPQIDQLATLRSLEHSSALVPREVANTVIDHATEVTAQPLGPQSHSTEYAQSFVDETHSYVREYIQSADLKAAFFFGATTAINAFLHDQGVTKRWLHWPWSAIDAVDFGAMALLALSSLLSLAVVVPRLPKGTPGLVYFGSIAEHTRPEDYARAVLEEMPDTLLEQKARHIHTLARVCRLKYQVLRAALWVGAVGILGALATLLR